MNLNFLTLNLDLQSQAMNDKKCQRLTSTVVHAFEISNYNSIPFLQGITRIFSNVYIRFFYGESHVPTSHKFNKLPDI